MRLRHLALGSLLALSTTPVFAQDQFTRVKGTIQSFDGTTLTVHKLIGPAAVFSVPNTARIMYNKPASLGDIKPGDFVASGGMTEKDGRIHAKELRIFPASMNGLGEGQYPMAQPKSSMTNATVSAVSTNGTVSTAGGSGTLKLTFHGSGTGSGADCTGHAAASGKGCTGTTQIDIGKDVPVTAVFLGEPALLKPGAAVSAFVVTGPDGKPAARYVTVEKDGIKPAM